MRSRKRTRRGSSGGEAVEWLRKVNALHSGIDPSRDVAFAALRGTREFEEIMEGVRRDTPPVSRSQPAFAIAEGDLQPESMAFDFGSKQFFFGSMSKGKVVQCSRGREVLGLRERVGRGVGIEGGSARAVGVE